jgi:hypothetical protein
MIGITMHGAIGIGDRLQFTSFPENYFRNTGERVIDLDHSWVFDHNPFVVRNVEPDAVINLWTTDWPWRWQIMPGDFERHPVFTSTAERTGTIFGHKAFLRHARLYRFEELPIIKDRVVLHTTGSPLTPYYDEGEDSLRRLSPEILEHIRQKYADYEIIQIGASTDIDAQVIDRRGIDIWESVKLIAQAAIFIGVDSGPYWIASCYPRVFRKKVLMSCPIEQLRNDFIPMHVLKPHWQWHDASCLYFNRSTDDAGITYSYLKL